MAYGAAVDMYRSLLSDQQCPKMLKGINDTKQQHPEQAFVLDKTYYAMCDCQLARLQVIQSKMSVAEKQEMVSGTDFQARLKTLVLEKCVGEMARAVLSEQSCAQTHSDVPKPPGYCHCISEKLTAISDADAMELGLASSDYIPRLAEAKKKGLPIPEPPPSFKKFQDTMKACGAP
jgi:hypothetical protein